MQSHFVIALLACHLKATEGAIVRTGHPVGALSVAGVSVSLATFAYSLSLTSLYHADYPCLQDV